MKKFLFSLYILTISLGLWVKISHADINPLVTPDSAQLIHLAFGDCGDHAVLLAYYDLDGNPQTAERVEFMLNDETIFAAVNYKNEQLEKIYILNPDKSISEFKDPSELTGAPCDYSRMLLAARGSL